MLEGPGTPPADIGEARAQLANVFLHGDRLDSGRCI
jgi:hypothetical protein